MATVERMYESNGRTPVVLVCHSLGTKVGHYLCDFAGREWCDRYVHTYMPVGAPHLGAPKALRGNVTGDAMVSFPFLGSKSCRSLASADGNRPEHGWDVIRCAT